MRQVEILAIGRIKESALRGLCRDYYRRCSRLLSVEERELKDERALRQALPARGLIVALDERGDQLDSRQLAQQLAAWIESAGRLVFVIGGPDGLGDQLRARADRLLSLSRLTFGHRIARVVFAEQLYRAVSIIEGLPYHR